MSLLSFNRIKIHFIEHFLRKAFYIAGSCFPLPALSGCREQLMEVNDDILLLWLPQYLQVYFGFSLPSYNTCLPLPEPLGWREQLMDVSVETLDACAPQYLQLKCCAIVF
jgi:hypothetical protein